MQSKDLLETSVQKVVAMVHQGGAWGMGAAIQGLAANSFAEIQGQASLGDHDDTDLSNSWDLEVWAAATLQMHLSLRLEWRQVLGRIKSALTVTALDQH